jgi:hypothetical protein
MTETRNTAGNTGLAKVAVLCSADTFVVKIATFAKPENVTAKKRSMSVHFASSKG